MLRRPLALATSFLALSSCGEPKPPRRPPLEAEMIVPRASADTHQILPKGAVAGPSGFATLLLAPPSEYEPPAPPDPVAVPETGPPGMPYVAPEIAHLVRLLPRLLPQPDRLVTRTMEAPPITKVTIILREGCFRLKSKEEPLVLLPPGIRAFLDKEGYLSLGGFDSPSSLSGRVGEPVSWEGEPRVIKEPSITGPMNRLCGPGKVVQVGLFRSAAASQAVDDVVTARSISDRYGTPYPKARREVAACRAASDRKRADLRKRYGDRTPPVELLPSPCMLAPPAPVAKPSDCPPGTTLEGGLCRDQRNHVVPVPPRPPLG